MSFSRVSEDRQDGHGGKCRLNRSPMSPRLRATYCLPGCCASATRSQAHQRGSYQHPQQLRASSQRANDVNGPVVVCAAVPPSLLDKPSSGVGEVMGPRAGRQTPATSTSFQYRVHKAFLYVPKRGSAWGLRAACEKSPYPVSSP